MPAPSLPQAGFLQPATQSQDGWEQAGKMDEHPPEPLRRRPNNLRLFCATGKLL